MTAISTIGRAYLTKVSALYRDLVGGSLPPTADFTFTVNALTATFTDASTDPDVKNTLTHAWDFGDGATSTAQNPSRTYAAAGTYSVTLTVTDSSGKTGTITKSVTV